MDGYRPEYNCSPTAGSPLGVKHSEATRVKAQIRNLVFGRKKATAETRAKMSAAHRAYVYTPEELAKRRQPLPASTRQKISEALRVFNAAHPLRPRSLGRKVPAETRLKISERQKGRRFSPAHVEKLCEAQQARWARIREGRDLV